MQRRQRPPSLTRARATLLIATGWGKIRASTFSFHHLLTSGIKEGSYWHRVREARLRRWGVVVVDPNARGEGVGYETLRRSVVRLFPPVTTPLSLPPSTPPTAPLVPPRRATT